MRLKISNISILFCIVVSVSCMKIEETNGKDTLKTGKETYCVKICEMSNGDPYFDEHTEKCYCTIKKEHYSEDKECKIGMKIHPKIYDIHIIFREFYEPPTRVRRSETAAETMEAVESTNDTVVVQPEGETNPIVTETETENEETAPVDAPNDTDTEPVEPSEAIVEAEDPNENTIDESTKSETTPRKLTKITAARKTVTPTKTSSELVSELQQKVDEFVGEHPNLSLRDAQLKLKDIQSTFTQLSNRLKQDEKPQAPTLQERMSKISEKFRNRGLIVEPSNDAPQQVQPAPEGEDIVGTPKKHPVPHRHRPAASRPSRPRIHETTEHESHHETPHHIHETNEVEPRGRARPPFRRHYDRTAGAKHSEDTKPREHHSEIEHANDI